MSRRYRNQTAVFKAWSLKQQKSGVEKHSSRLDGNTKQSAGQPLSISQIIGQQESAQIIHDPREYQLELFERAKHENTIAVLDTGTGKTLIAALLLRHVVEGELEDRANGKPHRISFFLVPAVNLVFQQHAVLEANLEHTIARIHGGDASDRWTQDKWTKVFEENRVVVCTAAVLQMCLGHGFIRMEQVNLIIFDEAHHAKLNHPYSKIMNDHYNLLVESYRGSSAVEKRLPRIFSMTASPVDIKRSGDHADAARELEETLHSKIATTKHLGALTRAIHQPRETTLRYASSSLPVTTPFSLKMQEQFGGIGFIRTIIARSSMIGAHLGLWCANMYWTLGVSERIVQRSDAHIQSLLERFGDAPEKADEDEVNTLRQVQKIVSSFEFPGPGAASVSPKVAALSTYLEDFFGHASDNRCIVFVKERNTAKLLAELFSKWGPTHLRVASLVGVSNLDYIDLHSTLRQQVLTLQKFRKGQLNCLFSTSVAEEGLDVADCNVIVRFDPCETMIQYIQSRGRARHKNSHMVHLLESGNQDHLAMLHENQQAERQMRLLYEGLPEDRRLAGADDLRDPYDGDVETFTVKETGATLTTANAMVILTRFTAVLAESAAVPTVPVFHTFSVPGGFASQVILPQSSPFQGLVGSVKRRKAWAKHNSAFLTCVELRRKGLLDGNLLPTLQKRISLLQKAALALDLHDSSSYTMKGKPDWSAGTLPDVLYPLLVRFPQGLGAPHRSIVILSRKPLTQFPEFPVYLPDGQPTPVNTTPLPLIPMSDLADLDVLTKFTLKILKDVFNKTYEFEPAKMPFWLVPANKVGDGIDFEVVQQVCQTEDLRWHPDMSFDVLENRFLIDPFSGANRYFTRGTVGGLTADSALPNYNGSGTAPTIIQATISALYRSSKGRKTWDASQPVLEATKILYRSNPLAEPTPKELEKTSLCYVCPEPLIISPLPTDIAIWFYALPGTIGRIEAYMVALEACMALDLDVEPSLALQAVTKDSSKGAGDLEGLEGDTEIQRGMGMNYERLEFIGDTFLKMATSISVYIRNPNDNEFEAHTRRMLMLCNQNLFNVAVKKRTFEYIRSQATNRRSWYPDTIKLQAGRGAKKKQQQEVLKHRLSKKTVADVSEALIGAALVNATNVSPIWTPAAFDQAVRAVTTLVENKEHKMLAWKDYQKEYEVPAWQSRRPRASELELVDQIYNKHPYKFRNAPLLRAVFTHPQLPQQFEDVRNYQQLEFLGDSLLDMAAVSYLFDKFPNEDEGWLTEHKMAMVSNKFLSALCVKLGFRNHLRHADPNLGKQIMAYARELNEAEEASQGAKDFWTTPRDAPKTLADIVEAFIGAIFLDSGFNYGEVQRFFDMHILPFFQDMALYDTYTSGHPITKMQRQMDEFGCRNYRMIVEEIPTGDTNESKVLAGLVVHQQVIGGDYSESSRYAKLRCAAKACQHISGMPLSQFKLAFNCNCGETMDEDDDDYVDEGIDDDDDDDDEDGKSDNETDEPEVIMIDENNNDTRADSSMA